MLNKLNPKEIDELSLVELQEKTGIHSTYWSRWFRGQRITEKSLCRAAAALEITPGELLDIINFRRGVTRKLIEAGRALSVHEYLKWKQKELKENNS